MKPNLILLYLTLITLFITGCHPIFCIWDMGFRDITVKDEVKVVGTYKLTDPSKKMMQYEGNYTEISESYLIIYENGTYSLKNAPDWVIDSWGKSNKDYIDHSGRWSLSCDNNESCIFELNGIGTGDILRKKNDKLYILLTLGDPDGCRGMVYEKQ